MASDCVVVVAPADVLGATADRVRSLASEVVTCTDAEVPHALDVISQRRPACVAVERVFAHTSRGIAFVGRLRADPALEALEVRIVAHDSDYVRVAPRRGEDGEPGTPALDRRGTRRAPRVPMAEGVSVLVDGTPARLIDLSTLGAQVVSQAVLRPNQRIRVTFVDERVTLRVHGTVAWAMFELPKDRATPHYRAGLEFGQADAEDLADFARRHRRDRGKD